MLSIEIIITLGETMAHLLKTNLIKELFGTEKYRAVNWVTQNHSIINWCDCIRAIKKNKNRI